MERKYSYDFFDSEESYRMWVRDILNTHLHEAEQVGFLSIPVKRFMEIAIEETFRYLRDKKWPSPITSTALILDLWRETVSRTIAKLSKKARF